MNEVACQVTLICNVVVRIAKTGFLVTKSIFPCLLKRKIEGKIDKYDTVFNRILNLFIYLFIQYFKRVAHLAVQLFYLAALPASIFTYIQTL